MSETDQIIAETTLDALKNSAILNSVGGRQMTEQEFEELKRRQAMAYVGVSKITTKNNHITGISFNDGQRPSDEEMRMFEKKFLSRPFYKTRHDFPQKSLQAFGDNNITTPPGSSKNIKTPSPSIKIK